MIQTLRKKIERFQTLLVNATDFAEPLNYFLDEIAHDSAFYHGNQELKNPTAISIMLAITESMHHQAGGAEDDKAEAVILQFNKKYKLAHGTCRVGNSMAIMAYLRELDMGIAGLPSLFQPSLVIFARFTGHGIETPAGKIRTFDLSGYKH